VRAFGWLETWGKTPLDFGLRPDEVDPGYEEAMLVLKNAVELERRMM
jgi:hypothetical protein